MVLAERFIDPHIYREGREITIAGEIIGEKTQLFGQMEYRYPLLLSNKFIFGKGSIVTIIHPLTTHITHTIPGGMMDQGIMIHGGGTGIIRTERKGGICSGER